MTNLDYEGFWKETLIQLRNDLGEEEFGGWFSDMKYLRCTANAGNNSIVVGVPSAFHRDKVKNRYQSVITSKLKELSGSEISVEYEITGKTAKKETTIPKPILNEKESFVAEPKTEEAKKREMKRRN